MDIERKSCSWINYGVNDLSNTPLWGLIQEKLNSNNLKWEDVAAATNYFGIGNIRPFEIFISKNMICFRHVFTRFV